MNALTPADVAERIDQIAPGSEDDDPRWVLAITLRSLDLTEVEEAVLRLIARGGWES